MGEALRGGSGNGRAGRGTVTRCALRVMRFALRVMRSALSVCALVFLAAVSRPTPNAQRATLYAQRATQDAPTRFDRGRFTVVCFPGDAKLATSLLDQAVRTDSFPGLPRPQQHILIAIAPDARRF